MDTESCEIEKGNLEKSFVHSQAGIKLGKLIYQIKITNSSMGQDLVPLLREERIFLEYCFC